MQKTQPHLIPWDRDMNFHQLLENVLSTQSQSCQAFASSLTQTSAEVRTRLQKNSKKYSVLGLAM